MVGVGRGSLPVNRFEKGGLATYRSNYLETLSKEAGRQGVDFSRLLIRSADLFPNFLPQDRVPEFLMYSSAGRFVFLDSEIWKGLGPYNQISASHPLTLWDITVGADNAEPYYQRFSIKKWKIEEDRRYLEEIYYFLRGVDPPAAGAEEIYQVKSRQIMASVGRKGVLSSKDLAAEGGQSLGSSDLQLSSQPHSNIDVGLFRRDLDDAKTDEFIRKALYDVAYGGVQVSMERADDSASGLIGLPQPELEGLLSERAQNAVVVVIDPMKLNERDRFILGGPLGAARWTTAYEAMLQGPIPSAAITAAFVPQELEGMVREDLPSIPLTVGVGKRKIELLVTRVDPSPKRLERWVDREVTLEVPDFEAGLSAHVRTLPVHSHVLIHTIRLFAPSDVAQKSAGAEEREPDWNRYAPRVKRLLYPGPGSDLDTVQAYLARFPLATDVDLVDPVAFRRRKGEGEDNFAVIHHIQLQLSRGPLKADLGDVEIEQLEKTGKLDLPAQFDGRTVMLHFRLRDFLQEPPEGEPFADLTIVRFPGLGAELSSSPEFWRRVMESTSPGGLISLENAHLPPQEIEKELDAVFMPAVVAERVEQYRNEYALGDDGTTVLYQTASSTAGAEEDVLGKFLFNAEAVLQRSSIFTVEERERMLARLQELERALVRYPLDLIGEPNRRAFPLLDQRIMATRDVKSLLLLAPVLLGIKPAMYWNAGSQEGLHLDAWFSDVHDAGLLTELAAFFRLNDANSRAILVDLPAVRRSAEQIQDVKLRDKFISARWSEAAENGTLWEAMDSLAESSDWSDVLGIFVGFPEEEVKAWKTGSGEGSSPEPRWVPEHFFRIFSGSSQSVRVLDRFDAATELMADYLREVRDVRLNLLPLKKRVFPPIYAGMEETWMESFMRILEEAAPQGPGVLVIEAGVVSSRIGLAEFVARVPRQLADRLVLFGKDSAEVKEIAARNGIAVVDSDKLSDLVLQLMVLGDEADQVGYLGNPLAAAALDEMLPMEVTPLDPETTLDKLLRYLGYPDAVVELIINAAGAEELFAGARAA